MNGPPANGPGGGGRSGFPEGHLFFQGDDRLEGILEWPAAGAGEPAPGADGPLAGADGPLAGAAPAPGAPIGGVVVAHPHPLNGGTMAQPVVYRIAQASRQHGLAALRFNFRGVGGSLGSYSGTEEWRDVEAAASYLAGRLAAADGAPAPGPKRPLALAGYSFGSVMAARAAAGWVSVQALALVGFVVSWRELPPDTLVRLAAFRGPVFALCAGDDDLAPPQEVERILTRLRLDFTLEVVEGAGHFLEGRHREVGERVADFLLGALAPQRAGERD